MVAQNPFADIQRPGYVKRLHDGVCRSAGNDIGFTNITVLQVFADIQYFLQTRFQPFIRPEQNQDLLHTLTHDVLSRRQMAFYGFNDAVTDSAAGYDDSGSRNLHIDA